MIDLQEMSDYLAEHLLGWQKGEHDIFEGIRYYGQPGLSRIREAWFGSGKVQLSPSANWHPHTDIAQCFRHIVPAMEKKGYSISLNNDDVGFSVVFWNMNKDGVQKMGDCQSDNAAVAIVEAAYRVIKEHK